MMVIELKTERPASFSLGEQERRAQQHAPQITREDAIIEIILDKQGLTSVASRERARPSITDAVISQYTISEEEIEAKMVEMQEKAHSINPF